MTDKHGDCIAIGGPRVGQVPNGFWTRERIAEAIILWSDRYGEPPSATDWNASHAYKNQDDRYLGLVWPRLGTVQAKFGSWGSAIEAAGFQPRGVGAHGPWKWAQKKHQNERRTGRKHRDGLVYCALAVEAQIVKIGFTRGDPKRRLEALQTSCPHRLELIKVRHGGSTEEKRLHDLLETHQKSGEWFAFNEQVSAAIFARQEAPLG